MDGQFWVVVEHWKGRVSQITYEALAVGREVADQLGASLHAVLLGHNAREFVPTLGKADCVIYIDHPLLSEVVAETYAEALVQLLKEGKPRGIIFPLTNVTLGAATLLGARLRLPVINFCTDIQFAEGKLQARCVLYGGKIESRVAAEGEPAIFGLWPGARPAEKGLSERHPLIEEFDMILPEPAIHLKKYIEPEAGDVDITQQEVLVAVGRGIQSQENLHLAEAVAKQFHGAVCASRPVIDQGWLPLSRQVGKSGATVKPKLYLALGISGAPEHAEGMKSAALIVAVNTDRGAPIFNIAHYGIVGDVLEVLPALSKAIESRKGVGSHA
ncbi:MAG TPA: electron transfer flavoprotein subunit alpha/FixB family protein [Candidatus Sulfotelmatobacter sp.]|nr:electron transfer flavoprotein subunit alpha/FixB family protein [Candidatus Sulfotelmatobacter sp.]